MAGAVGSLIVHDVLVVLDGLLDGQPSGGRGPVRPGGECRGRCRGRSGVAIEEQAYAEARTGNVSRLAPGQASGPRHQPDKSYKSLSAHYLRSPPLRPPRRKGGNLRAGERVRGSVGDRSMEGPLHPVFEPELIGPGSSTAWRGCAAALPKCTPNPGRLPCQSGMRVYPARAQAATLTENPDVLSGSPGCRKWLLINGLCASPESLNRVVLFLLYPD